MKHLAVILVLLCLLNAPASQAQRKLPSSPTASFAKPITIVPGPAYPDYLAVGDINHDGILDVAVIASYEGQPAAYSLGSGNGNFPSWDYAPAASEPAFVALADLNGDGNLDLITADFNGGDLAIDFGDGKGNFAASVYLNTVNFYGPFAVADLNGDGLPDIVGLFSATGKTIPGGIAVVLGSGNGQFRTEHDYSSGGYNPAALAVVDLNHDGIPDLVVANTGFGYGNYPPYGSLAVLLGNGDGTFQAPATHAVGKYPSSVALGDLNGDGNLDIAVTISGGIAILLGDGKGGFSAAKTIYGGQYPGSVVVADFDGDGKQDLAVVNEVSPRFGFVAILMGNGDGSFQKPLLFPQGGAALQLVVADFNGDGKPDLATANYDSGTITVLLNTTP